MRTPTMRGGLLIGLVSIGLTTANADELPPSADFLAFLAEMEQVDGEWVDPMSVDDIPLSDRDDPALTEAAYPVSRSEHEAEEGTDNE